MPVHDDKTHIANIDGTHILEIAVCDTDLCINFDTISISSSQNTESTEPYDADEYDKMKSMSPGLLGECISLSATQINDINKQLEKITSKG